MNKVLLLQIEKDIFYDKDGNKYVAVYTGDDTQCSVCHADIDVYVTKASSKICFFCVTILQLKEVLEAQLFKIKLEKQRQADIEKYEQQRSAVVQATIETEACAMYEAFAHYDEVNFYRRPTWVDLCESDKERWYHAAEYRHWLIELGEETT